MVDSVEVEKVGAEGRKQYEDKADRLLSQFTNGYTHRVSNE